MSGTSLIIDRYSYSGVAFSAAKGLDVEWCKLSSSIMRTTCAFFLYYCSAFNVHHSEICNLYPMQKAAERGGYGTERYEKLEFQKKVAEHYRTLYDASWKVAFISEFYPQIVDGDLPVETLEEQIRELALGCMLTCQKGKPLSILWQAK
ncbi:hypothetical protein GW17_00007491 [Ensete ventricosum]|uniref:dTMP kinase n=1 Tax=Ensete ventricosum TaxID=4639 RepID=A0A444FZL6_ENSVE|nr:hypothetical protein B296_00013829 [Ensete ventricosum]RWW28051.1 hypothetical protein GW17_00007491 [Ensete ventricosum]